MRITQKVHFFCLKVLQVDLISSPNLLIYSKFPDSIWSAPGPECTLFLLLQVWASDYVMPTWLLHRSMDKVAVALRSKALRKREKGK